MNYAQQLRNTYFQNKERRAKQRTEHGLCSVLTLHHELIDGYDAYKKFCYLTGVQPKKIGDFLRTEVI